MSYYKTSDKNALQANATFENEIKALRSSCDVHAEKFGGKAVTASSLTEIRFGGLIFEPCLPAILWTKPIRGDCPIQRPRSSVKGIEAKKDLESLMAQWNASVPKARVSFSPVYEAMGFNYSVALLFGLEFFEHEGAIYLQTNAIIGAPMVEILGSEFNAAKNAIRA